MYVPASFAVSDEKILESFIERYDFATLTSSSSSGLVASHIPIMLRRSAGKAVLVGHVARANSHWRQFDGSAETLARLGRGEEVDASEYTFRASTQIETASRDLEWMNKSVFISVGGIRQGSVVWEIYLVG